MRFCGTNINFISWFLAARLEEKAVNANVKFAEEKSFKVKKEKQKSKTEFKIKVKSTYLIANMLSSIQTMRQIHYAAPERTNQLYW